MTEKEVRELIADAKESPRLSQWEYGFIKSIEYTMRHGMFEELTVRQLDKLKEVREKVYAVG